MTNFEQLRLWVPEAKLDLVHGRLVLQRVGGEVLDPRDVEVADADIADLALVDQLLELLPGRVRVRRELFVENLVTILLECDGPICREVVINEGTEREEEREFMGVPVDEVQIEVVGAKVLERAIETRLDVLRSVKVVPQLQSARFSIRRSAS